MEESSRNHFHMPWPLHAVIGIRPHIDDHRNRDLVREQQLAATRYIHNFDIDI